MRWQFFPRARRVAVSAALAAAAFVTLGCVTTVQLEEFGEGQRWEYKVRESDYNGRQRASLSYRGQTVGSDYSTIVAAGKRFDFQLKTDRLGFEGYELSGQSRPRPAVSDPPLSEQERKQGWYLAAFDGLRRGTPDDWVWVRRENISAWVDPGRLSRLAARYDIVPILGAENDTGTRVGVGIGVTTIFRF
jgi:hypothetical protein